MKALRMVGILACAACVTACIYEDDPPHQLRGDPDTTANPPAAAATTAPAGSTATPPAAPASGDTTSTAAMLVEVDTDQTMNAVGGEGVGVFVEYGKGGHWHVWWTCDTNQTQQSCDFSLSITAAGGDITNVDATELAGGLYSAPSPSRLEARSTTSTEVRGLHFDTQAGDVITVEAALGSVEDGSFLFFVQDGKVNGGFTGKLTNPLRFQGNSP